MNDHRSIKPLHLKTAAAIAIGGAAMMFGTKSALGVADDGERYRLPSPEIVSILDAEPLPSVAVSPSGTHMLLLRRENLPPIAELARPMVRLAGQRIDPDLNAPHGPRTTVGITIVEIETGRATPLRLPADIGIAMGGWSPSGESFIFEIAGGDEKGVALWIADLATGAARRLVGGLNALGPAPRFMPDGEHVLVALIPEARGDAPWRSPVPTGPNVIEDRSGRAAPVRTFQDLLQDAHDEALFAHHFTSQLALVATGATESTQRGESGRAVRLLGGPAVYANVDPSPTGTYLLVSRVDAPYSRQVTMWGFARTVELWDDAGRPVKELVRLPIADRVPIGGVLTEPRSHQWRDTVGTEQILWVEALDEGNPRNTVDHRDRLMMLAAPFDGEAIELMRIAGRFGGMTWIGDGGLALVRDFERNTRWTITTLIDVDDPSAAPRVIAARNNQDRYADPGTPEIVRNAAGRGVAQHVSVGELGSIYLTGFGATPEGNRPFLDRFDLATGDAVRLWQNTDESYERVVTVLDDEATTIVTRRETPADPPNYYIRRQNGAPSIRRQNGDDAQTASWSSDPLTTFPHPAPQLRDVQRELVRYTRDDGVELTAMLYLPPGYDQNDPDRERLPLVVWAYPQEFNDADTAGQTAGSPYEFTMFGGSSHLFLLLEGYAVLDRAAMPVVGADPDTVNDTFIEQIVASGKAAIDFADELGIADRERIGVGGHSYGAFMTANLLAHSDLFRAGIARSGAYNRTLTPFGFQAERRTLWEAPDIYASISPFMHADKIDDPILIIHGEIDNNSGTFPVQSERLYHAVVGHGGTARLVMLPHESHGYRARESVLHVLAEQADWFNEFVKNGTHRRTRDSRSE